MWQFEVPNAPCGVERILFTGMSIPSSMFLMHRVELKARNFVGIDADVSIVPNAPCGVESLPF
jgi:hypothetical protein